MSHGDIDPDEKVRCNYVSFEKCQCGKRRVRFMLDRYRVQSGKDKRIGKYYASINISEVLWREKDQLHISWDAHLFDHDYSLVSDPGAPSRVLKYQPVTKTAEIVQMLKDCNEFKAICRYPMVNDALEELEAAISQLEVAIKLHENIGDFAK